LVKKVRTYSTDPRLVNERRNLIAERSLDVFLQKGFEKSTLRDLGAACDMTPGALYHYIGSKEDILQLISRKYSPSFSVIRKRLDKLGDVSRKKALFECFTLFCRQQVNVKGYNLLFEQMVKHLAAYDQHKMGKYKADVIDLFRRLLIEGIENKEFLIQDIELVVYNLFMYGYNWAVYSWFLEEHYTLDEYAATQFQTLFEPSIAQNGGHFEQEYSPVLQPVKAVASDI